MQKRWLEALESVLVRTGTLIPDQVDERTYAVLTTTRDASHQWARREPVAIDARVIAAAYGLGVNWH